jgi:hypothetical protein
MKSFFYFGIVVLFFSACSSDDLVKEKSIDLKSITDLQSEITALAESSVCNESVQCSYIAFGSKACGGPTSFLLYSTSINVNELTSKVAVFNQMQRDFNQKYGIISDCSIVIPPSSLVCENNKCKAIY